MTGSGIGSWRGSWKGWKDRTGKTALFSASLIAITGVAVLMTAGACWAGQNLIFIVDASASMAGPLGADSKIGAVREALIGAVKTLPGEVDAGLLVFGGRRKGDCDDVATALPVGKPDVQAFARKLAAVSPTGMTPLAAALAQLRRQVKGFRDPTTAVIVADGQETCLGDPCEEARRLKRIYRSMVIHVVGLDVPLSEETSLVCISGNTGGRYHRVTDKGELKAALARAATSEMAIPAPADAPADIAPPTAGAVEAEALPTVEPAEPEPAVETERPKPAEPEKAAAEPMTAPTIKRKAPEKQFKSPAAKPMRKIRVRVRRGRVRAGPSLSSEILFHVDKGARMSVLGVRGDWNHVMDDKGRSGWAHYSLFSPHLKPAARNPGAVPRILDIGIETTADETRVTFGLTRPIRPKVAFLSRKGPTVVCDFPGVRAGFDVSAKMPDTPAGSIREMRAEPNRPSGFRTTMALAPGQSYRLQHFFLEKDLQYRMIIRPAAPPGPAAAETDPINRVEKGQE